MPKTKPERITSKAKLEAALDALAPIQQRLVEALENKLAKTTAVEEEFASPIAELEEDIQARAERIAEYVLKNREAVLGSDVAPSKVTLETGELQTKNTPLKADVPDKDELIKALVEGRHRKFIRTAKSADMAALKKAFQSEDGLPAKLKSKVGFNSGEQLIITPVSSGLKITLPIEAEEEAEEA